MSEISRDSDSILLSLDQPFEEKVDTLRRIQKLNVDETGAKTPHETRCKVGHGGNVKQVLTFCVPRSLFTEVPATFSDVQRGYPANQIYLKALMFLMRAIHNPKVGYTKNGDMTFKSDHNKRESKYKVKVELLVKDMSIEMPGLIANDNIAGYRFWVIVLDPTYSVEQAIQSLIRKNKKRNAARTFKDDGEAEEDNSSSGKRADDKKDAKKREMKRKHQKFKDLMGKGSSSRGGGGGGDDDLEDGVRIKRIENNYKTICTIKDYFKKVVFPLTGNEKYYEMGCGIDEAIDLMETRGVEIGQRNMHSLVWGSFDVSKHIMFSKDEESGRWFTEVCLEQMLAKNYARDCENSRVVELFFPCDDLVCEYSSEIFKDYKRMRDETLPFSISILDACIGTLQKKHAINVARKLVGMPEEAKARNAQLSTGLARIKQNASSYKSSSSSSSAIVERRVQINYNTVMGKNEIKRDIIKSKKSSLDANEAKLMEIGGLLLVHYTAMKKRRQQMFMVRNNMPEEYNKIYPLIREEGFRRFMQLCSPDADVAGCMKSMIQYYNENSRSGDWSFIYSRIRSIDPSKGMYINMEATERIFGEAYMLFNRQHNTFSIVFNAALSGQNYYRFMEEIGEPGLSPHIMMVGPAAAGKSHVENKLQEALIEGTVDTRGSWTSKSDTGDYEHGKIMIQSEFSADLANSKSKNISNDQRDRINKFKTEITEMKGAHEYIDLVSDGNVTRRIKRKLDRDRQLVHIVATNSAFIDDAVRSRLYEVMMNKSDERAAKTISALSATTLDRKDVHTREYYYSWLRSTQFLTMAAFKMQCLSALPKTNVNLFKVYYDAAVTAISHVDKKPKAETRSFAQAMAFARVKTMRCAIHKHFHSETAPGEVIDENMQSKLKPFHFRDLMDIAPYLCIREDTAIDCVMQCMSSVYNEEEHEILTWVAVTLCDYKVPRPSYLTDQYVQCQNKMFGKDIFRGIHEYPVTASWQTGDPCMKNVQTMYNGEKAFYCKGLVVPMDIKRLAGIIASEKKVGKTTSEDVAKGLLYSLRKRVLTYEYSVYRSEGMMQDQAIQDNWAEASRPHEYLGSIKITAPVLEILPPSSTEKGLRLLINLAFIDQTPQFYQHTVLKAISHARLREGGTILTDTGMCDIRDAYLAKLDANLKECKSVAESISKRAVSAPRSQTQVEQFLSQKTRLTHRISELEMVISQHGRVNGTDQCIEDAKDELESVKDQLEICETTLSKANNDLDAHGTMCRTRRQEFIECLDSLREEFRCDHLEDEGPSISAASAHAIRAGNCISDMVNATHEDVELTYGCDRVHEILKDIHAVLDEMQKAVGNMKRKEGEPLINRTDILKQALFEKMLSDGEALWCDADQETREVLSCAITRVDEEGRTQVLYTTRYLPTGSADMEIPYLQNLVKAQTGAHELVIPNSAFMDDFTIEFISKDFTSEMKEKKRVSKKRRNVFETYSGDLEIHFYNKHLKSIGIPRSEYKNYYPQNVDNQILCMREMINRTLKQVDQEALTLRMNYPSDFRESALRKEREFRIKEKTLMNLQTIGKRRAMAYRAIPNKRKAMDIFERSSSCEMDSGMMASSEASESDESDFDCYNPKKQKLLDMASFRKQISSRQRVIQRDNNDSINNAIM